MIFGNINQTNTTATFNEAGVYTLMLSASNGIHSVAYDAVVVTATPAITLAITREGTNLNLTWTGGAPPYVIERATNSPLIGWSDVVTTSVQNASVPITAANGFFRIRGN